MSSPGPLGHGLEEDVAMDGPDDANDEGAGDAIMPHGASDDSSEEEEDDPEEERRIKQGFIVDEEEDPEAEEAEEDEEERRPRKKRRRRHDESEELDEDDLDLITESTGVKPKKRLTRLKRRYDSPPAASSSRRAVVDSSDDDLDDNDAAQPEDIHNIWDDEDRRDDDDDADADMDDFIEYEDEDGAPGHGPSSAKERRQAKLRRDEDRRKNRAVHPHSMLGIDANAWQEMHDVFGDGREYEEHYAALVEAPEEDETQEKVEIRYDAVFEPTEIRNKMLTEDDEIMRMEDVPERMQLTTSSLSRNATLISLPDLTEEDLNGAALWVTQRISDKKNSQFFSPEGLHQHLKGELVFSVTLVLKHMFIEHLEVPHIWTHKRDDIIHFDYDTRARVELIVLPELWKIYALGQKYRSLLERKKSLQAAYARLSVEDKYFEEEILAEIDSIEVVADATEWLHMLYKDKKADDTFRFHDDEEEDDAPKKHKTPSRISVYEVTKKTMASRITAGFGLKPQEVVQNYVAAHHLHFIENQDLNPLEYAERYADPDPLKALSGEDLLRQARMLIATEMGKDPVLRNHIRKVFKEGAVVTVLPTDRGKIKIDEHHPYYNFKYLSQKPIKLMLDSSQFLRILDAESKHLVTVSIFLPRDKYSEVERRLTDAFTSDSFDESAKAWNEERALIVKEALDQHLVPVGAKWVREYLREEVEDFIATSCASVLRKRVDVAPYTSPGKAFGETSSVLAMSWGQGDPQRDDICIVYLDERGLARESTKIANLYDQAMKDEFFDLIKRRQPDVIVIGGFTMATTKLSLRLKELLRAGPNADPNMQQDRPDPEFQIPVIYVRDDVARMYQHSDRATKEFPDFSEVSKYCVGLARYTQSPLNEYGALGADISAVSFDKDDQHLVPPEKLLIALERVLVDITNKVGVDINRASNESYYGRLLPFVCGLGPRKAEKLTQKIQSMGGNLANRSQFLKGSLLGHDVFMNAAGFLRIYQEVSGSKNRRDDDNVQDPLDSTRVHPADYELARKMAVDAMDYDEEDVHDEHPSFAVKELLESSQRDQKLAELNLDEFAISLHKVNSEHKRHTLNVLRAELLNPYSEQRSPWTPLAAWDVLTMLSGESEHTLRVGLIVSVWIHRLKETASVRLDSGIEGVVSAAFLKDPNQTLSASTAVQGVVLDVKLDLEADQFMVELSTRHSDIKEGDGAFRRVRSDDYWDLAQNEKDLDILARKKRAETANNRRIIKHPNFHNFNTAQAEAYLEKQQRGDVVIRPSSKGNDHLAVTWKVDTKLYQHIDVTDRNPDPSGQSLGGQLVVDAQHIYSDLDELIVNHVQAMVRRVEELMNHERFKAKSEDELHQFLKQQLAANPAKSMYGFTLNRKRPGHFTLCFLANKQAAVQSWPVRVTPEAYYLFEAAAAGVAELCDAFKVRHLHQQNLNAATGGRTPFGAGMRTPARPTGGMTPGYASVRQTAATPNPYGGGTTPGPARFGNAPPQSTYGYQTPSHHSGAFASQSLPAGMNPQRAAMIQDANPGWGGR